MKRANGAHEVLDGAVAAPERAASLADIDRLNSWFGGMRLDYVLASHGAMPFVKRAAIHPEVFGSDHCPVSVDLDPKVR